MVVRSRLSQSILVTLSDAAASLDFTGGKAQSATIVAGHAWQTPNHQLVIWETPRNSASLQ